MFHSSVDAKIEESILASFLRVSNLSLVIATVSFGMAIGCADIYQICHVGP